MSSSRDSKRKKRWSKLRWFCAIFFGVPLVAILVLVSWSLILKSQQPEFALPLQADEDADFLPLPAPPATSVSLSLAIPFASLRASLLGTAPEVKSRVRVGGYVASWNVANRQAAIRRSGANLLILGKIGGELNLGTGSRYGFDVLGGKFRLSADYTIRTGVSLRKDWRLYTNPSVKVKVYCIGSQTSGGSDKIQHQGRNLSHIQARRPQAH